MSSTATPSTPEAAVSTKPATKKPPFVYSPVPAMQIRREARRSVVGRDDEILTVLVGLTAGLNTALVGVPGTAKTHLAEIVTRAACGTAGTETWQLHPQSLVDELLGGVDPESLIAGKIKQRIKGSVVSPGLLAAILDEAFKAANALLSGLLRVTQDGKIRGHDGVDYTTDVVSFIALSNEFPSGTCGQRKRAGDLDMAALWDRFHLRAVVEPLSGAPLRNMACTVRDSLLRQADDGEAGRGYRPPATTIDNPARYWRAANLATLKMAGRMSDTTVGRVCQWADMVNGRGLYVSNRKVPVMMRAACGHAIMHGRSTPSAADLRWASIRVGFEGPDSLTVLTDNEVTRILIPDVPVEISAAVDEVSNLWTTQVSQWGTPDSTAPDESDVTHAIHRAVAARAVLAEAGRRRLSDEAQHYTRIGNNLCDRIAKASNRAVQAIFDDPTEGGAWMSRQVDAAQLDAEIDATRGV